MAAGWIGAADWQQVQGRALDIRDLIRATRRTRTGGSDELSGGANPASANDDVAGRKLQDYKPAANCVRLSIRHAHHLCGLNWRDEG